MPAIETVLWTTMAPSRRAEERGDDDAAVGATSLIALVVLLVAWVLAVRRAVRERGESLTADADVLVAWFSPVSYWLLRFVGGLGVPQSAVKS